MNIVTVNNKANRANKKAEGVRAKIDETIVPVKNLIDESKTVLGEGVHPDTGGFTTDDRFRRSVFINIDPLEDYVFSTFRHDTLEPNNTNFNGAYYDSNQKYISGIKYIGEIGIVLLDEGYYALDIPENAEYVTLAISSTTRLMQLEKSTTGTEYKPFYIKLNKPDPSIPENIQQKLDEKANSTGIEADQTAFVSTGKNLMDESTIELEANINPDTGGETSHSSFKRYDYAQIDSTKEYMFTTFRDDTLEPQLTNLNGAYYDKDKNYISGIKYIGEVGGYVSGDSFALNVPANAVYVRFAISSFTRLAQLEEGTTNTYYEEYNLQFSRKQPVVTNVNQVYKYGNFSMEKLSNWYSSKNTTHTDFNDTTTITDFHNAFNSLLDNYPSYATITDLGLDSSGTHSIYKYELTPENLTHGEYFGEGLPKVVIINGQHGDEKEAMFALYYLVKDMLENWETDSTLEYLRYNVQFIIIPCANPSGFENMTRTNSNDVDLNRNYDYNWESDTSTKKGTAPFSEVETQYIKDVVDSNSDAVLLVDYHSNNSSGSEYRLTNAIILNENEYYNKDIVNASYFHIKKTTRHFSKDYDSGNNGESFGYITLGREEAMLKNYAKSKGLTSSVFEGFRKFPSESTYWSDTTIKANVELTGNWLNSIISHFRQETKTIEITKD